MKSVVLEMIFLCHWQHGWAYYQAQYAQVAPLQSNRDVCINMIPPYIGRRPLRNRAPLHLEIESQWISHKRVSICAVSKFDRYQAFSGMMVQVMKDNLPYGEFENDTKTEIVDCSPGNRVREMFNVCIIAIFSYTMSIH